MLHWPAQGYEGPVESQGSISKLCIGLGNPDLAVHITLQRLGFVMNCRANPLLLHNVMLVPGSPAVIWNTPGEPSFFAKRESSQAFVFPMILKGFWETLSKVVPLQCVAGAPLRQRSGDPAPTRICWVAGIFKSVCFSNDFEAFWGHGYREPIPKMMRWDPLRQHSGASWKTFVFPMLLRMRQ